ncbi:MAG: hypothetical protein ACYC6Q_00055 [Syntrophales bacterium]
MSIIPTKSMVMVGIRSLQLTAVMRMVPEGDLSGMANTSAAMQEQTGKKEVKREARQ